MRGLLASAVLLNLLFVALRLPAYPAMPWIAAEALLLAGLFALLPGYPWRRIPAYAIGCCYAFLALCAAADALIRQSLGRSLNLYLDLGLLQSVYDLLETNLENNAAILAVILIIALAVALAVLVGFLLSRLRAKGASQTAVAGGLLVAGTLALLLSPALQVPVAAPAVDLIRNQIMLAVETRTATAEFRAEISDPDQNPFGQSGTAGALQRLEGADVILGFVESYGLSSLTDPRYALLTRKRLETMQQALDAAGLHVVSGRLRAPIQGGQSWLAHATLLSGQWVDSQLDYEILLASDAPTLVDDFRRTGHESVAVMPAITRHWPEGRQLGYNRIYDANSMGYQGPPLNWVTMPDQYTWSWFQHELREEIQEPIFAVIALISSHAPWVPILPVLQNWEGIGTGKVFNLWKGAGEAPDSLWQDNDRVREHYSRAIDYALAVAAEYAVRYVDPNTLLIILGDHQPAPLITGENASRDVPVHVISGNPALLEPFVGKTEEGQASQSVSSARLPTFQAGILPGMEAEAPRMDEFRPFLQRRFSAPETP